MTLDKMDLLDLDLKNELIKILSLHESKIKELNIDYIGYREFYQDGSSVGFCSNDKWYELPKDEILQEEMAIHYAKEIMFLNHNSLKSIIRSGSIANNRFLKILLDNDICNSLLIYQRSQNIIRQHAFIAPQKNTLALSFFSNKIQEFEHFINSYQANFSNILGQSKYQILKRRMFSDKVAKQLFEEFSFTNPMSCYNLTEQEVKCAEFLAFQASDKEIARKLGLSLRTVQWHISNIKKKLSTNSRFEVYKILKQKL